MTMNPILLSYGYEGYEHVNSSIIDYCIPYTVITITVLIILIIINGSNTITVYSNLCFNTFANVKSRDYQNH